MGYPKRVIFSEIENLECYRLLCLLFLCVSVLATILNFTTSSGFWSPNLRFYVFRLTEIASYG